MRLLYLLKLLAFNSNREPWGYMMPKQDKKIEDMTEAEWEAVCNRCGKCCYYKYLIEETDELEYGEVCEFLDERTHLCTCYETRSVEKPDCLKLTAENIRENAWWLPEDCAYRKLIDS